MQVMLIGQYSTGKTTFIRLVFLMYMHILNGFASSDKQKPTYIQQIT